MRVRNLQKSSVAVVFFHGRSLLGFLAPEAVPIGGVYELREKRGNEQSQRLFPGLVC